MKLIGYVISQTVYKKNVCLEIIVISENSCLLNIEIQNVGIEVMKYVAL